MRQRLKKLYPFITGITLVLLAVYSFRTYDMPQKDLALRDWIHLMLGVATFLFSGFCVLGIAFGSLRNKTRLPWRSILGGAAIITVVCVNVMLKISM